MARLVVTRQSTRDARQRQVYVSLDDQRLGLLVFNDRLEREIAPGRHVLKANNTLFWKSASFEARPGEEIRFSLVNYEPRGFMAMIAVIGVAILLLSIEREDGRSA